jgi:Mn2+/Fe2+ NRAMP family transporter
MHIATIVVSVLLAAAYVLAGASKVGGTRQMMEAADHFGIFRLAYRGIGALELLGAIGLLAGLVIGPLGTVAAICLVVLMVGAVSTHLRAHDPVQRATPAAALGLVAAAVAALHVMGG